MLPVLLEIRQRLNRRSLFLAITVDKFLEARLGIDYVLDDFQILRMEENERFIIFTANGQRFRLNITTKKGRSCNHMN